jgi:FAD/FMN-containing dehydrogenase
MSQQDRVHGIDDLCDAVRGRVILPGDADYEGARMPWNVAVDQRPAAVVEVADAEDVVAAVRFARDRGLRITAQPSGHGATHDLSGTILIRPGALDTIVVDAERRTVRAGAGVRWGDLLARTDEAGLAALCGSSPEVSVVGYTLGGGLSWLGRSYGLAANSVRAVELVNARGELVTVDAERDPELFWAIRGGGGSFGIVTAIELALYPVPEVFGGQMVWPVEHAGELLAAFRRLTDAAPDELSATIALAQVPPLPTAPEPLRGRHIVAVGISYEGDEATGRELVRPLTEIAPPLLHTLAMYPIRDLGLLAMDPVDPIPNRMRSAFLADLGDETIAALLAQAGEGSGSPLTAVQVRHLGGALARPETGHGVAGHIQAPYLLYAIGALATPELAAAIPGALDALFAAVTPSSGTGRRPLNFTEGGDDLRTVFSEEDYARLGLIKAQRDPRGVIDANHRIAPGTLALAEAS